MTSPRARDPRVDALRGILIVGVVVGHVLLRFVTRHQSLELAYWWVYLVHMPGFAVLSGIVVRDSARSARTAVRSLLPVYLGFSLLHIGMRALEATGGRIVLEPLWSPGLHWYLLALMVWRLVLPLFDRIPRSLGLVLAIAASLAVGFLDSFGPLLSASRIVVYLPFFLAGRMLGLDGFARLAERTGRLVGAAALAGWLAIGAALALSPGFRISELTGKLPYSATGDHWWLGFVVRIAALVCTGLVVVAGAALLPRRAGAMSRIGADSMPVYLLHLYLVYPLDHVADRIASLPLMWGIILVLPVLAVALCRTRPASRFVAAYSRLLIGAYDALVGAARGGWARLSGGGARRSS